MKYARWAWSAVAALALTACGTAPQTAAPPETGPDRQLLSHDGYGLVQDQPLRPIDVYADSTYARAFASFAVNENTDTQWASGGYQEPRAWLALQFLGAPYIDYVRIKTGPLSLGAYYRFEVSNDGHHWRPVTPPLRNTSWQMETKSVGARGRFLRVHFFNSDLDPMPRFSIFEIDVFGRRGFGGYGYDGGYHPSPYGPDRPRRPHRPPLVY